MKNISRLLAVLMTALVVAFAMVACEEKKDEAKEDDNAKIEAEATEVVEKFIKYSEDGNVKKFYALLTNIPEDAEEYFEMTEDVTDNEEAVEFMLSQIDFETLFGVNAEPAEKLYEEALLEVYGYESKNKIVDTKVVSDEKVVFEVEGKAYDVEFDELYEDLLSAYSEAANKIKKEYEQNGYDLETIPASDPIVDEFCADLVEEFETSVEDYMENLDVETTNKEIEVLLVDGEWLIDYETATED